jgi:hypothetical protein
MACGCRIVTTNLPEFMELFAEPHPSMVRLVEASALESVDRPFAADEALLEGRLTEALRASIADVENGVEPDWDYVRKITGPFGWDNIFARIEAVYKQALEDRRQAGMNRDSGDVVVPLEARIAFRCRDPWASMARTWARQAVQPRRLGQAHHGRRNLERSGRGIGQVQAVRWTGARTGYCRGAPGQTEKSPRPRLRH